VRTLLVIAGGLVGIATLLAVVSAALYGICWLVILAVSRVPMVGRKHRHSGWGLRQRR
jgi:hypothetical protein